MDGRSSGSISTGISQPTSKSCQLFFFPRCCRRNLETSHPFVNQRRPSCQTVPFRGHPSLHCLFLLYLVFSFLASTRPETLPTEHTKAPLSCLLSGRFSSLSIHSLASFVYLLYSIVFDLSPAVLAHLASSLSVSAGPGTNYSLERKLRFVCWLVLLARYNISCALFFSSFLFPTVPTAGR